jgi:hypothetical protein
MGLSSNTPMRLAPADPCTLRLEHLWVVYPGHQEYSLDDKISVIPIDSVPIFKLPSSK